MSNDLDFVSLFIPFLYLSNSGVDLYDNLGLYTVVLQFINYKKTGNLQCPPKISFGLMQALVSAMKFTTQFKESNSKLHELHPFHELSIRQVF